MAAPIVTITNTTRTKISDEVGANVTTVSMTFDVDISGFTAKLDGASWDTGTEVDTYEKNVGTNATLTVGALAALTVKDAIVYKKVGEVLDVEIDNTELIFEGNNRVNFYGKGIDGTWSTYTA